MAVITLQRGREAGSGGRLTRVWGRGWGFRPFPSGSPHLAGQRGKASKLQDRGGGVSLDPLTPRKVREQPGAGQSLLSPGQGGRSIEVMLENLISCFLTLHCRERRWEVDPPPPPPGHLHIQCSASSSLHPSLCFVHLITQQIVAENCHVPDTVRRRHIPNLAELRVQWARHWSSGKRHRRM